MASAYAKQQILRTHTQAMFPYLIEINHEDLGTFYYINSSEGLEWNGKYFNPVCFSIQPPEYNSTGLTNATLTMTAIDQEWIMKIRSTNKRAKIRFLAAMVNTRKGEIEVEVLENIEFVLTSVSWNEIAITWTMEVEQTIQTQIPLHTADATTCPGCA